MKKFVNGLRSLWDKHRKSKNKIKYYSFEPVVLEPNNEILNPVDKAKDLGKRKAEMVLCLEQGICYFCGGPTLVEYIYDTSENDSPDHRFHSCSSCKIRLYSERF